MGLPPAWVDISEEISDDMQRARTRMNELVKAHAKALRPIFGDNKGEQQVIESLTREITTQLKKCEKNLQRLSVGIETGEDANLRKNVQVRIRPLSAFFFFFCIYSYSLHLNVCFVTEVFSN